MIKKLFSTILRTLLWYTISVTACVTIWVGLEYAICGTVERRSWDIIGYLVCVLISRRITEHMVKEK